MESCSWPAERCSPVERWLPELPEPQAAATVVVERWSAKPVRSMATTIESAAARLDELDDEGLDDEP